MDKTRLNKVSRLLQKELSDFFLKNMHSSFGGSIVSVTVVRVTSDLSLAKIYISIFPKYKEDEIFKVIKKSSKTIRYDLAGRVRKQLRKIPELHFYIDDSLDYAGRIDELLKN